MKTAQNIFNLPALILHELSHVLVSMLFGAYLNDFKVKKHTKGHIVVLLNIVGLKSDVSVLCVAMSPILVPMMFVLLSIINPVFSLYFVYAVLVYKTTLPSPTDFKVAGISVPSVLEV
mgnify:CR=1 FL=1|jgi:hypothetical protein